VRSAPASTEEIQIRRGPTFEEPPPSTGRASLPSSLADEEASNGLWVCCLFLALSVDSFLKLSVTEIMLRRSMNPSRKRLANSKPKTASSAKTLGQVLPKMTLKDKSVDDDPVKKEPTKSKNYDKHLVCSSKNKHYRSNLSRFGATIVRLTLFCTAIQEANDVTLFAEQSPPVNQTIQLQPASAFAVPTQNVLITPNPFGAFSPASFPPPVAIKPSFGNTDVKTTGNSVAYMDDKMIQKYHASTYFPVILHRMLLTCASATYPKTMHWNESGTAFQVDMADKEAIATLMSLFFKHGRYESFRRQLNVRLSIMTETSANASLTFTLFSPIDLPVQETSRRWP